MIQAKVVADSIGPNGDRLITLEVVFPRYILAEFNTHRMLSKNSASSRAIPFNKMVKSVQDNPFIPMAWQEDHKGMQGSEYITDIDEINNNASNWSKSLEFAIQGATVQNENNVTKQLANRLLEPFMYHKVLVSGTEWENFFKLRCPSYSIEGDNNPKASTYKSWKEIQKAFPTTITGEESILTKLKYNKGQADIHMMFLAEAIYDAMKESTPRKLKEGEWHMPYMTNDIDKEQLELVIYKYYKPKDTSENGELVYDLEILGEVFRKISIARCARLSYQTLGDKPVINYEADLKLYDILSKSGHWSPFEHVAKVMNDDEYHYYTKTKPLNGGVYTERGWCRNYKGFIQYRELLDN